jgi:IS5 family transposase
VVAANVAYPTDSGLLTRAIALLIALVGVIHAAGAASRTRVRDRRRAAGRRARAISAHLKLRNDEAKARVLALTGELAELAEATAADAGRVLVNARRCLARQGSAASGRLASAVAELEVILGRTGQVIGQTRSRLAGVMPASATRLVSLHTRTPARSRRAGWANRSSSATSCRSATTRTGSCSTTACTWATRPTRRCSPRQSAASTPCSPASWAR